VGGLTHWRLRGSRTGCRTATIQAGDAQDRRSDSGRFTLDTTFALRPACPFCADNGLMHRSKEHRLRSPRPAAQRQRRRHIDAAVRLKVS